MTKRLTTDEFVKRAKLIHGDKYDYKDTVYTTSQNEIVIICKKHGAFKQKAAVHLRGSGCPKCADERTGDRCRHTTEDFVAKAISIHGDKFDYTNTVYVDAKTPVKVFCKTHGFSWQLPNNHLKGHGCELCARENTRKLNTKTTEKFIEDARKIHGDKYGYENVKYINCSTPVSICCKKHGYFEQLPTYHLQGCGCPECWKEDLSAKMLMNTESFIEKAKRIHGDKYDYSLVNYKSSDCKVMIKCDKHGVFEQDPTNHLMGQGCPQCWNERRNELHAYNTKDFIEKAKKVHGDLYDYSESVYKGCFEPVCIKCNKHGVFWQRAGNHLFGQGCPHCKRSFGEEKIETILKKENITFIIQYIVKNENLFCSNEKFLVDFYLPDYNTIIEYNGRQHYIPIGFFGGNKTFEQQKNRDMALRQYCKEHGIKLIEIPYTEFDNIEDILTKELKIHKNKT